MKYTYDLIEVKGLDAKTLLEKLQNAIEKYGIDNVRLDHEVYDYYDSGSVNIYLNCRRPFTKEELEIQELREKQEKRRLAERDRNEYERLKAKFELNK